MLNSIILLGGLVSAFGLGALNPIQEKQDNVQFRLEYHKAVQYDDSNYQITLSVDELNNNTWDNLYHLFDDFDFSSLDSTFMLYNSITYNVIGFAQHSNSYYASQGGSSSIYYPIKLIGSPAYDIDTFSFNERSNKGLFSFDLVWNLNSSSYNSIKQAIELDIQENIYGFNNGIFETLTDSVMAFIGSLGSGIVSMTGIFYDSVNNTLTTIGLLSVIVVAVSLTYFLFRLIIGLIRMRG